MKFSLKKKYGSLTDTVRHMESCGVKILEFNGIFVRTKEGEYVLCDSIVRKLKKGEISLYR